MEFWNQEYLFTQRFAEDRPSIYLNDLIKVPLAVIVGKISIASRNSLAPTWRQAIS